MNKENLDAVEVEGIDMNDYPDFCDSFISYAEIDGVELTDDELDELNEDTSLVYEYVMAKIF